LYKHAFATLLNRIS